MEMDCFGLNMMSNQMVFSIDVLHSIMELLVLGQIYYRAIINHEQLSKTLVFDVKGIE